MAGACPRVEVMHLRTLVAPVRAGVINGGLVSLSTGNPGGIRKLFCGVVVLDGAKVADMVVTAKATVVEVRVECRVARDLWQKIDILVREKLSMTTHIPSQSPSILTMRLH